MNTLSKHKRAARVAYAESLKHPALPSVPVRTTPSQEQVKATGWEHDPPRCENCRHVTPARTLLHKHTSRLPVIIVRPICERGRFHTSEMSVCDFWAGRDGSTL